MSTPTTTPNGGTPLPKCAVMVTFDDGFRDHHEIALPVRQRRGVPALFFLSTGYTDSQSTFWFDWIGCAFVQTPIRQLRLHATDRIIALSDERDHVKRLHVKRHTTHAMASAALKTPEIFASWMRFSASRRAPRSRPSRIALPEWLHS